MMYNWFFIFGACVELVTANPLTQSFQPCPITSYQTNAYQPYSDAVLLQPSNANPYSQHITIQSPLSYQPLLLSSLKDQIYQIYWDNVLSSPTLKSVLDGNSVLYNHNVKETQTIPIDHRNPYNTGGVVNNYIILPPEYFKINETIKERRDEQINSGKKPRRRKGLNKNDRSLKGVPTNTALHKEKHIINTNPHAGSRGIKCYTPADVLDDRIEIPYKKDLKYKNSKRCGINKSGTKENKPKNKKGNRRFKPKKTKKKKVKKKSMKSDLNECQENIAKNVATKTKTRKKHLKRGSDDCVCEKRINTEPLDADTNRERPRIYEKDINDILNLNQECTNFENRQTRNSKSDAAVIDFRKIYPDIPDDISKSFSWYMSDFFSNPHLMSSNLYPANNMYPYDFTQIYQIPKYSTDVTNKRKDANASNKRKKKSKKKKKKQTKKKSGQALNNTDGNLTPKRLKNKTEKLKEPDSTIMPSTITDELTPTVEISTIETTTPIPIENDTSKEIFHIPNEEYISLEEDIESSEELFYNSEANQSLDSFGFNEKMILADNPKMEVYETQIPDTIDTDNTTNNRSNLLDNNEMEYIEAPSTDLLAYDQFQELGLEVFNAFDNRLMEDYYPDFTGDNLKYLSKEEIDLQNLHNRYFYRTDKNMNSNEIFQSSSQPKTYRENQLSNYESSELEKHTDDINKRYFADKSEEIVYKTPPSLEFPGFITRKINRDRQDSNEIYYQHNNGDDFERFHYDSFADKSEQSYNTDKYTKPNDKSGNMVETVYARSKVVKYGQCQNHQPSKQRASKHFSSVEDRFENDGGKMVIIAKSLRPEDSW